MYRQKHLLHDILTTCLSKVGSPFEEYPAQNRRDSTAAEAKWLKESDIVFGVEVNGADRAYPRRIMEVREMVNDTLGGRDFDFRNNRDARGPIFPVGDVDPRLPVHEDIIGVVTDRGAPVAFQRSAAMIALTRGQEVGFGNVRLRLDGGGIRAVNGAGADLGSHQAFWFAWSQFHPGTALWPG